VDTDEFELAVLEADVRVGLEEFDELLKIDDVLEPSDVKVIFTADGEVGLLEELKRPDGVEELPSDDADVLERVKEDVFRLAVEVGETAKFTAEALELKTPDVESDLEDELDFEVDTTAVDEELRVPALVLALVLALETTED
jgi:hypothetical protein